MKGIFWKFLVFLLMIIVIIIVVYNLGPRYDFESFNNIPFTTQLEIHEIDDIIRSSEDALPNLKEGNQERIVWFDSIAKTEFVILYLHGFSASHEEGHPVHKNIAKKFGANLLLSRLPGHGLEGDDVMLASTAAANIMHAKELVNMASQMGDKLIIVCTSTGATIASYLAAADERIKALVMLSPNFAIQDPAFDWLDGPWGQKIAQKVFKGNYRSMNMPEGSKYLSEIKQYWSCYYRIEALLELDYLVSNTMIDAVFKQIKIPYFIGYYYKNENEKDNVISIDRIKEFDALSSTPKDHKEVFECDECGAHVMACSYWEPNWQIVENQVGNYLQKMMDGKWIK